jgi:hypothetical protein
MSRADCKALRGKNLRPDGRTVSYFTAVFLFGLIWTPMARAAFYHDLENNRQPCNDCHTLHYSEDGNQPQEAESGGPFQQNLIRSTTNKLCLFCHDGSDPNAPDVLDSVTMYDGSGDEHSGAGFFAQSGGSINYQGHDLGSAAAVVPFSTRTNVVLTCASCHDPHGTANYRNLLAAPAAGAGVPILVGRDIFRDASPGDPPSAAASVSAYRESNMGYRAQTSLWCAECHELLKPAANNPQNRIHHLTGVRLNGEGFPTDPSHWLAGSGVGFGGVTGDGSEGVPRLRFQNGGANDYTSAKTVAADNEIMCISCHLAHGGKYKKGLVWPYLEIDNPADANSGCQQCHNF